MYEWGGRNGMDGVPVYSHGVRQLVVQSLSNEPNFTVRILTENRSHEDHYETNKTYA